MPEIFPHEFFLISTSILPPTSSSSSHSHSIHSLTRTLNLKKRRLSSSFAKRKKVDAPLSESGERCAGYWIMEYLESDGGWWWWRERSRPRRRPPLVPRDLWH